MDPIAFEVDGFQYTLTTAHSASSYGVPVVVHGRQAYGAYDTLPHGETAISAVSRLTGELAEKFKKSAPSFQT
jgi:hypothetical protein